MARSIEFDRDEVMARAVDAFWRYGYEALPANVLAGEMGVSKSSLYNTFGSKRQLFLEAIETYVNAKVSAIRNASDATRLQEQLRGILLHIITDNDGGRGCFLVNTSIEFGLHDPEVRRLVLTGFQSIKFAFESIFIAGQRSGQFRKEADPATCAMTLIAGISGLRVLAKAGYTERQLSPVIDSLMRIAA